MKNVLILVIAQKMLIAVQETIVVFVLVVRVTPEIHMDINAPLVS